MHERRSTSLRLTNVKTLNDRVGEDSLFNSITVLPGPPYPVLHANLQTPHARHRGELEALVVVRIIRLFLPKPLVVRDNVNLDGGGGLAQNTG